jgi:hypothetical protein
MFSLATGTMRKLDSQNATDTSCDVVYLNVCLLGVNQYMKPEFVALDE